MHVLEKCCLGLFGKDTGPEGYKADSKRDHLFSVIYSVTAHMMVDILISAMNKSLPF